MSGRSSIKTSLLAVGVAMGLAIAGPANAKPLASPLKVAAAADLANAFAEVGKAFTEKTGQKVTFSFGSTGLLARQIEQGAPFDVFAAANISYAEDTIHSGDCDGASKTLYARGRIVVWTKKGTAPPKTLAELANPRFSRISIANPAHAPYGQAAMQALASAGIVAKIKPRLVYGENVRQALQFAQTGNADAAVVALSLAVIYTDGNYLLIDKGLHQPIDQALVLCGKDHARLSIGRAFTAFVDSPEGRSIMKRYGFLLPGEFLSKVN